MLNLNRRAISALAVFAFASASFAQTPTPAPQPPAPKQPQSAPTPPAQEPARRPGPPKAEIKPYKDVITAEAKTQEGLFKVHRIDDKIYWEIPENMLGRDMLWYAELAELPQSQFSAFSTHIGENLGSHLVRFERHDKRIYMRVPNFGIRAEGGGAIQNGVDLSNVAPIVASFPIEAEGPNKTAVIDVTNTFALDQGEFAVGPRLGAVGVDPTRSYIDRVSAFPMNIETRVYLTLGISGGGSSFLGGSSRGSRPTSATVLVHSSLVLLPEKPMMGRYADSRVGYFATDFELYGGEKKKVEDKSFIERFRLEKKDPSKEVSDPVQPVVFYVSREVPEAYRPYVKKGIEAWQEAFAKAGFSNAIIAKDAPTKDQDPSWDPEDVRYSVIRWVPSSVPNAMGPHVSDPRSGETLSAHVIVWHNLIELVEGWYFAQCASVDPLAHRLPFPDDLTGRLIEFVVTHEVGHTLGLEHNFKASSFYTTKQLRDPAFTNANGLASSVMDYARFNYVEQPGDNAATIGKLGPYDNFAIEWGYKPVPNAHTPEDEKVALDLIAARQVNDPKLRFDADIAAFLAIDPTAQTEDIGDDPIEAGRLGLANISRTAKFLVPATTQFGEDYDELTFMYSMLLGQRSEELGHVVTMVGGVVTTDYHAGRGKEVYTPVPAAKQAKAVKFLMNAMTMPPELVDPEIVNRITPSGVVRLVTGLQSRVLQSLFRSGRIARMADNEAVNGSRAYTVAQMAADVQKGVWSELDESKPKVDTYRRALQRSYLDLMDSHINGDGSTGYDLKGIARYELQMLAKRIDKALPKTQDVNTVMHLQDCRKTIEKIMSGKTDQGGGGITFIFNAEPGVDATPDCFDDPTATAIYKFLESQKGK